MLIVMNIKEYPRFLYSPLKGASNPIFRVILFSLLNKLELKK